MTYLENLSLSVIERVTSGQIGTPVFARLVLAVDVDKGQLLATAAEATALVTDLLQVPVRKVFASGGIDGGHLSLQVELDQGRNALVAVALRRGQMPGVDLLLIGNHGTLHHEANDQTLAQDFIDETAEGLAAPTARGRELKAILRKSLSGSVPVSVRGGSQV